MKFIERALARLDPPRVGPLPVPMVQAILQQVGAAWATPTAAA